MSNVVQAWAPCTRIQAHVRRGSAEPASYILICIEALDGDEYVEAVTSEQTFDSHGECLDEAIAWAGHPHSAIVWDHVTSVVHDPNGAA
jgi:hypothetical protein